MALIHSSDHVYVSHRVDSKATFREVSWHGCELPGISVEIVRFLDNVIGLGASLLLLAEEIWSTERPKEVKAQRSGRSCQ